MNFREIVKKHIAPVVLATSIGGSILATNPVVAHANVYEESIVSLEEEKTSLSTLFLTQEEAQYWIKNRTDILSKEYNIIETKIYLYKGLISDNEIVPIDESFDNEDDALERLEELENDEYYAADVVLNKIEDDLNPIYILTGRMIKTTCSDRYIAEIKYMSKTKEEIINEHEDTESDKQNEGTEIPRTSDDSNIELYSMMLMGSSIGLLYMGQKVKKKKMR